MFWIIIISSFATNFDATFESKKVAVDFRQLHISAALQSQSKTGRGAESIQVYIPDFSQLKFRV